LSDGRRLNLLNPDFKLTIMKKLFHLLVILSCILLYSCKPGHTHDETGGHTHDDSATVELEPLAFTLYSDKTELFIEFKPLVVGTESRFAAHFTILGEYFKPITEGTVSLSLSGLNGTHSIKADKPEVPGIFRLRMIPEKEGIYQLVFSIKTPTYMDTIVLENITVYPDEKTAFADQPEDTRSGSDISYLKEQAWKVDFATVQAQVKPFSEIIRTSGQILSAPGDEVALIAQVNGIISFAGQHLAAGSFIGSGTSLFTVKSNEVVTGTLYAEIQKAESDLTTAKANYDRASELVKEQIISQKEFVEVKLRYENAQTALNTAKVNSSFNTNKQNVTAPIGGYLKNILVENGQYVTAGQTLATISKNKKLILRAEVSQKYFSKLSSISSANFKTTEGNKVYSTRDLHGKLVSYGKSADANTPFVPITFEIDNHGEFIPGSVVEVFLQSGSSPALLVPYSSLLEEQGIYYVYVQTAGESFQKREIKMGATDGIHVQVLSGVAAGERVVSKGAYQIKLSTASGTLPAHGHEH
jgi:membrane fusion protein, heavy metal efflux system